MSLQDSMKQRKSKLSAAQQVHLRNRLSGKATAVAEKGIYRRNMEEAAPLSFAQKRLWFLDQMEPNQSYYNLPKVLKLTGSLEHSALENSLSEILRRHETLRTVFSSQNGEPVQVVQSHEPVAVPVVDLTGLDNTKREAECERLVLEEMWKPFDLEQGPLFRATLFQMSDRDHLLVMVMHHIVTDGWSNGLLFEELSALYDAFRQGKIAELEELTIQYGDFAAWQEEQYAEGSKFQRLFDYWKNRLQGASPFLELPTDHKRPLMQTFRGLIRYKEIPHHLFQALKDLSHKQGATMFMTQLAAFQALLYKYTGQEDILVGTPSANRNQPEIQKLIGFFANTLVFRTDFSNNPTFLELLQQVRQLQLEAYDHQDLPFEKLVEELQPERNLSYNPIFQVFFNYQKNHYSNLSLSDLTFTPVEISLQTSKFDLALHIDETDDRLVVAMEYATDLFDAETIENMLNHFVGMLEGIVADPEQAVGRLPWMTETERQQWLQTSAVVTKTMDLDVCAHQQFEKQATLRPTATAVVYEGENLTYKELNERANRLAHYLQKKGVGPETMVGIYMERSLEIVVSILGILKAGGSYVPLDPNIPEDRLSFILEDSGVRLLLTQTDVLKKLGEVQVQTILSDRDVVTIAQESSENPKSNITLDNAAYVIYTSGSTGVPKGVVIPHRNITRLLTSTEHWYGFNEKDVWTLFHSYAFDFSVWEIWGALFYGGKLIVVPYWVSRSPEDFYNLLRDEKVTVLNQTPTSFKQLIEFTKKKEAEPKLPLRYVIFGGEALELQSLKPWFDRYEDDSPSLVNMYGITETTVHTTYRSITSLDLETGAGSVIGVPIPDLKVYVLDRHLQPVPTGVTGEIYVGGFGVARGYLNREALTAERFIDNPFGEGKLYKSGDLARFLRNGDLEYLGRIDNQVKIRGFRIELGEIESTLVRHEAVSECAVMVREDKPDDKRIVAYIVEEFTVSVQDLREFLKDKLPEYMVPSIILKLDAFTSTSNGKLDPRALPAPTTEWETESELTAPRTPMEEIVAGIFCDLLNLSKLGIEQNFFHLGGHSLLATQVVSRIRDTFRIDFPLRSLFEDPTVASLARRVQEQQCESGTGLSVRIEPISRENSDTFPMSFSQQRLWFLDQLNPGSTAYQIPLPLYVNGPVQVEELEKVFNELILRYESLRTIFILDEGRPVQKILEPQHVPLQVIDITSMAADEQDAEVKRLVEQETKTPFDLKKGPVFRFLLIRRSIVEHVLVIHIHHIVTDGWSMEVFMKGFITLYDSFTANQPSPLAPLQLQYADYAYWQRQWLQGENLENQLSYWREYLGGDIPTLQLPQDYSLTQKEGAGAVLTVTLPQDLSDKLRLYSRREGATLFMTLLAAFKTLLSRLSGQTDILIGTPIANRNRSEIEGLIGYFVNTLVLRTDLSGKPTFRELLNRIRENTLGAYMNQDLPFEKLVEEIQPERNSNENPLFDVLINYSNTEIFNEVLWQTSNLTMKPLYDGFESISKFKMTLYIQEDGRGINFRLVYRPDLFSEARMNQLLQQFQTILTQVVEGEDQQIGRYSLITESAQAVLPDPHEILAEPQFTIVTDLIADWAVKTPDKAAVSQGGRKWTFAQMQQNALSIAYTLVDRGLHKGEVVAVIGYRSFGFYSSMIGAFNAGGVVLSIDQKLPLQRQLLMIEQSGAKKVIYVSDEPMSPELEVVLADGDMLKVDMREMFECDFVRPLQKLVQEDRITLFFTSGTTGVPKGVLGRHKGLVHYLDWQRREFNVTPDFRCAQLMALSFDGVMRDIFLPLTSGATLCLPDELDDVAADKVLTWLEHEKITIMNTVPTLVASWLSHIPEGISLPEIQWVLICGEPLTDVLVKRWRESFGGHIVNIYGPTETTMAKCYYHVPEYPEPGIQPVGWTLPQTQAIVLNELGEQCGIGEPGEICLRTPFRTLGYTNVPEENAKKFISNKWNPDEPEDKLYHTGDRGRYRLDGALEIMGRTDDQVKIRGLRIELNEITAQLSKHPDVSSCVVVDRKDKKGQAYLAAYVVQTKGRLVNINDLRRYLTDKFLPAMVPSAYMLMERLPLTTLGKVDRKQLAEPTNLFDLRIREYVAPSKELEEQMVKIWEDVLEVTPVGINDNFFELGGHSMKALEILYEVRKRMKVDLTLTMFFQAQTVKELCQEIESFDTNSNKNCLVEIQKGNGNYPPLFLIHPFGGGVLCYLQLAKALGSDLTIYGLQAVGYQSNEKPLDHIEEMAKRYLKEIRLVAPQGLYRIAAWSFGVMIICEIARRLEEQGEKLEYLGFLDHLPDGNKMNRSPIRHVSILLLENMGYNPAMLDGLSEEQGLELVRDKIREGIVPDKDDHFETTERVIRVMIQNGIARQLYESTGPIESDIHLYRVLENAPISPVPLVDPEKAPVCTLGKVTVQEVPGTHQNMCQPPHVEILAQKMRKDMGF